MSKPLIGILVGAVLGAFDGLTAWFTPEVRDQLAGIVVSSTIKGIIAGVAIGFFAKKFNSLPLGLLFGLAIGAFLAYLTARFAVASSPMSPGISTWGAISPGWAAMWVLMPRS